MGGDIQKRTDERAEKSREDQSVWDWDLGDFLDRIASREPTPGGGSVAGVVAAQGLALVLMALEISVRRKEPHPAAAGLLESGRALLKPTGRCADEDMAAFEKYMDAMRMPRGNEEQNEARELALAAARSYALEAPLRAAERYLEGLELARDAVRASARGVASDVGAGAALLHGALTATLYNVDINLSGINDRAEQREAEETRERLQRRGDELAYVIHRETQAWIVGRS